MAVQRKGRGARAGSKPVSLEQIEREAVTLFSAKTYPVVGMRDISDAVGLLPGSLYAHIANKEDLLQRIVERGIRNHLEGLGPISVSDIPAAGRLRSVMRAYMSILDTTLEQTRVSFNQWTYLSPDNRAQIVELRREYEQVFARIVSDGIASGEFPSIRHPRVAVLGTIGILNSTMRWYSPDGELTSAEIGDELADIALNGLQR